MLGVLDGVLAKTEWLVGDKCSAADLSFLTYVTCSVAFVAPRSWLTVGTTWRLRSS